jgi:hypothetical protein
MMTAYGLTNSVEEVEQVRIAGADSSNFYVLGQSWGGILNGICFKIPKNLKGLIQYDGQVFLNTMPTHKKFLLHKWIPQS